MTCSIHQPNYLPYLGLFNKFKESDAFVLYDCAQYSKNDYHNRNKIKTPQGPAWLTVPVSLSLGDPISAARIADPGFRNAHCRALELNYKKAPFFAEWFSLVMAVYGREHASLMALNIDFLRFFFDMIDPAKPVVMASDVLSDRSLRSTAALVAMCREVGADSYIAGAGGRGYMEESLFADAGIGIVWQDFHHPEYPQQWGAFAPYMCALDALFNVGREGFLELI